MKKIISLIALLASSSTTADELHNFNAIKTAATSGKSIHIVVDFEKCTSPNNLQATFSSTFTPDAMLIVNNRIITSLTHFTLNHPAYTGKPIYEFVRYTIADDNNAQITTQTLDAVNYALLGSPIIFNCSVGIGAHFFATGT